MIRVVSDDAPHGAPVFTTVIPVRWGDMDAEGHVNNTGYFRFMEETRMRWVSGMGLPTQPPHPVIVLLNAACHYTRPLDYPATVEVALHAGRVGRSSLQTHYVLRHVEAGAVCAEGYATLVWYDMTQQKAVPLPDSIRAACAA
ncbi:MAG: acyl-CoA thioesterase [Burkholderiales bacterium]|jgi:acyl-CoA thioester hydrolase|nr:acyl-CoA thioesterase [Burkholderiales bacterium]